MMIILNRQTLSLPFFTLCAPQCGRPHNIQYGEPRDVKNRVFTANLNKRQAAELPQTKETHQWKV